MDRHRLRVFRDVGDFYEARSSIVHRRRKHSSTDARLAAFKKGFEVVRRSVVKLLEHGPPQDWNEMVVRIQDAADGSPAELPGQPNPARYLNPTKS